MDKQLQYLLDRRAIEDQIIHYGSLLDEKAYERFTEVFLPDAYIDYTSTGGEKGYLPEILDYLRDVMAKDRSQHVMGNIECTIAPDRQTAKTRTVLFNPMTITWKDGRDYTFFCGAWYNDDWVMTDEGVWKIKRRVENNSYQYHRPLPELKTKKIKPRG